VEQTRYTLRAGTLVAEVRPEYGGRITHFHRQADGSRQNFFRATPEESGDVYAPFKTGCYPLVPFSNRIDQGRFVFQGRVIELLPHPQAIPHAIHGHGAVSVWAVTAQTEDTIRRYIVMSRTTGPLPIRPPRRSAWMSRGFPW